MSQEQTNPQSQKPKPKDITDWDKKVFQSSNIHSAKYSPSDRTLSVEFGDGSEYSHQVSPKLWDDFKDAKSPGSFYHSTIRPNFPVTNRTKPEKNK